MIPYRAPITHALTACLLAAATLSAGVATAAESEVERTIAFIELREGPDSSSLTVDYLNEIERVFKSENKGDYIFVPRTQIIDKIGKSSDQLPRALTDERRTSLAEAKKKGIAYLDQADAVNAIKALDAASSKFRAALAAPGADDALRKDYLDILAQLAFAHILAKEKDKAEDVFRLVVTTFGPSAPITTDHYRPDVVEVFRKVVGDMQKLDKGKVDVASTPLGAKIILNGAERGKTPATVKDLIPGVYSLHLVQGSQTSMLHRVRIDGGKTTKIHIDLPLESHLVLEDGIVGLAYKDLDEVKQRVPVDALALGRKLEVNLVVATGVVDRKLVTYLIDVSHNRVTRSSSTRVPQVGLSKRAVTHVIKTIMGGGESPHPPWYSYKPGLALGAGGIVALGIGSVMALAYGQKTFYPCPNVEEKCANPDANKYLQDAKDAQSSHDTMQAVAGGLVVVGVALVGTAGYLFYKHSTSSTIALEDLPPPGSMHAFLPPGDFGSRATTFEMSLR